MSYLSLHPHLLLKLPSDLHKEIEDLTTSPKAEELLKQLKISVVPEGKMQPDCYIFEYNEISYPSLVNYIILLKFGSI